MSTSLTAMPSPKRWKDVSARRRYECASLRCRHRLAIPWSLPRLASEASGTPTLIGDEVETMLLTQDALDRAIADKPSGTSCMSEQTRWQERVSSSRTVRLRSSPADAGLSVVSFIETSPQRGESLSKSAGGSAARPAPTCSSRRAPARKYDLNQINGIRRWRNIAQSADSGKLK